MASTSTTLLPFSFLILLIFTFFCFTPYSPIPSSLLTKAISLLQVNASDDVVDSNLATSNDSVSIVHDVVSDHGDEVSDPGEISKPVTAVNGKDVVVLCRENFTEFIASKPYVMVNFYASRCYWSQKLKPEYSAAATLLNNTEAVLAKVDCSVEHKLCRDYNIQGYPSMFLFIRGAKKTVYFEARTRDAIATWMKLKMNPNVQTVETEEKVQVIRKSVSGRQAYGPTGPEIRHTSQTYNAF